jgi:ABC-type phosphate transport system ATPase subunit
MDCTKIILFEKFNITVIIIIMLEILLKKMAHIKKLVILILIKTVDSLIRPCQCGNSTIISHLHRY